MPIVAKHPGAPQGELGEYYFSYGNRTDEAETVDDVILLDHGDVFPSSRTHHDDGDDGPRPSQLWDFLALVAARSADVLSPVVERVEEAVTNWMARWSTAIAQAGLGIIYLWFGALKFVPGLSPAEGLVRATLAEVSNIVGLSLPATPVFGLLATWEMMIGIGLILDGYRRAALWMLMLHLPATLLPFLVVPDLVWTQAPIGLTLEGQYIIKNLTLLASASAVGAALRSREKSQQQA